MFRSVRKRAAAAAAAAGGEVAAPFHVVCNAYVSYILRYSLMQERFSL